MKSTNEERLELCDRITGYLSLGGLWNPDLANHNAVRDLLIDCRAALAALPEASPREYKHFVTCNADRRQPAGESSGCSCFNGLHAEASPIRCTLEKCATPHICASSGYCEAKAAGAVPEASPRTDERVRQLPGKWCTPVASSRNELEAVYRQCAEDLQEAIEQCDIDARTIAADFIKAKIVHITDPDLKGMLFSWAEDLLAAVPEASEPPRDERSILGLQNCTEHGRFNCETCAPLAQQHTHTPDHYDYCCSCKWVCSWVTSQDYGPHPDEACARQHAEHVREVPK